MSTKISELAAVETPLLTDYFPVVQAATTKRQTLTQAFSLLTSVYQPLATPLTQIAGLAAPGADRLLFWDHSALAYKYLTPGSNLTITDTTIDAAGGGATDLDDLSDVVIASVATGHFLAYDTDTWVNRVLV